jgi:hypothetical protein
MKRFDFYASVARCGLAVPGRNVSSGVHDHASVAERRHSAKEPGSTNCWRYGKSWEHEVGKIMSTWLERDTRCALAITSGARNLPENYVRAGMGVGLCVADAVGRHLLSADANESATLEWAT